MYYQYTDINAVKSIIENNSMRLTNIRFLNDRAEFHIGVKYLLQGFNSYLFHPTVSELCKNTLLHLINSWLNYSWFNSSSNPLNNHIDNLYVASFSKSNDVLSQWRGYGMYSLEFKLDTPTGYAQTGPLHLMDCHYFDDSGNDQTRYAANVVDIIATHYCRYWNENGSNEIITNQLLEMICVYALTFKHHSFTEENESRLIYLNSRNTHLVEFRTHNDMLIPFITWKFPSQVITKVTVGPVSDQLTATSSLATFIRQKCNEYNNRSIPLGAWNILIQYSQSTLKPK
ncbi:hypothetical protein [Pantoea ananatis]|uniref:hypothetical protein n=1 Tax=Pantoea ananas TaxID=553 RepID=UPI001B301CFB|nr:hypothetical protein [Pantoea ananatis]